MGINQHKYNRLMHADDDDDDDDDKDDSDVDMDSDDDTHWQWQWQDDDGSFKPFTGKWSYIPSKLDQLGQSETFTAYRGGTKYEFTLTHKGCIQTNTQTNTTRLIVQTPCTKTKSKPHHHHPTKAQYQWYWKDDTNLQAYDKNISRKIEALQINESYTYTLAANGATYKITKTSADRASQRNMNSNYEREVIRKAVGNVRGHGWFFEDDDQSLKPMAKWLNPKIDKLANNASFKWTRKETGAQYLITKLSKNQAKQKNLSSNVERRVVCKDMPNANNEKKGHSVPSDDEKEDVVKWYYEDDNGGWSAMDDWLSAKLNKLAIGETLRQTLGDSTLDFKLTGIGKGYQVNSSSNKKRKIRQAEYGWFFEENDKSLKPMAKWLNPQIHKLANNASFKWTRKETGDQYLITKISRHQAKQKNLSTNVERRVVCKMTLNETDDQSGGPIIGPKKVEELFHATLSKSKYKIVEVKDVSKSANFMVQESVIQEKCKKRGKPRSEIEKYLWHGTKDLKNLDLIINNGFDRSFNTASLYGKGTYFARDASYSANGYCGADSNGVYHIMLCRVIVGEYAKGNSGITTIPRQADGTEYDTLVDQTTNPSIFVVWRDYHAVPCYLVKYKKG